MSIKKLGRFSYIVKKDCWECQSHKPDRFGYSRAQHNDKNTPVHRIVFEMYISMIPKGKLVRHSCDNPKCINPNHLSLGTIQDNMRDRDIRGRTNRYVPWKIGEKNNQTRLKEKDVLAIRKLKNKLPQTEVAKIFGIGQTTVSGIQRGVYWKYLKETRDGEDIQST